MFVSSFDRHQKKGREKITRHKNKKNKNNMDGYNNVNNVTQMLQAAQKGNCIIEEAPVQQPVQRAQSTPVCTSPTNAIILDSKAIQGAACESVCFDVQNTGPTAKFLIWGTRGIAGTDPLFPGDPFVGNNFADAPTFQVSGVANGAPFQGFNYRCANMRYLMKSISLRNVPVASPLVTQNLVVVEYGCDPDNLCKRKKCSPTCSPCVNGGNDTFTQLVYNLGLQPIDPMHAVGLSFPAEMASSVNVETNIVAVASAAPYVPCGVNIPIEKQIITA